MTPYLQDPLAVGTLAHPDKQGWVSHIVSLRLDALIGAHVNTERFLALLSQLTIGTDSLRNIQYAVVGHVDTCTLRIRVTGTVDPGWESNRDCHGAKGVRVTALLTSDDRVFEIAFDATRWFEQATDSAIQQLIQCHWGGDTAADEVGLFFEDMPGYEELTGVFTYVRQIPGGGFEVHVDKQCAKDWLIINRPHLRPG